MILSCTPDFTRTEQIHSYLFPHGALFPCCRRGMPRLRLASGTVGTISVLPLGFDPSDPDKREVVIPQPATEGGDKLGAWPP